MGRGQLHWLDPTADLPDQIIDMAVSVTLFIAANHHGKFFFWPLKDGEGLWYDSTLEAIAACRDNWFATKWEENAFTLHSPTIQPTEPKWERLAQYATLVDNSLRTIAISDTSHVVVRRLLGETIDPTQRQSIWQQRFKNA